MQLKSRLKQYIVLEDPEKVTRDGIFKLTPAEREVLEVQKARRKLDAKRDDSILSVFELFNKRP